MIRNDPLQTCSTWVSYSYNDQENIEKGARTRIHPPLVWQVFNFSSDPVVFELPMQPCQRSNGCNRRVRLCTQI